MGDCETLRLECCRPRLSLSIASRGLGAARARGPGPVVPLRAGPEDAQVVPHAARASAVHGRERLHGPRATPLVERPDAEPSAEVVRGGLAVVAVLGLLGALRHGRQRGDGHGPGRGGPEPERGLRRAHVLHVDRALTTRARAPRWAEKIKPPSSDEMSRGSRPVAAPSVALGRARDEPRGRADADIGATREAMRALATSEPRRHRLRARAQCARPSRVRKVVADSPGHGCVIVRVGFRVGEIPKRRNTCAAKGHSPPRVSARGRAVLFGDRRGLEEADGGLRRRERGWV